MLYLYQTRPDANEGILLSYQVRQDKLEAIMHNKIIIEGLARLPAFCHAVVAGDFIFVSGTLGIKPDSMELVSGGTGPETTQTLRHIETILQACGASLDDVVKASVFLADMETFWGDEPGLSGCRGR